MYSERPSSVAGGTLWQVEVATAPTPASPAPAPGLVLPDGCMDIVWVGGRLLVAGPDTRAHAAPLGPGGRAVGLRFAPGTAPAVLGVAAHELVDQRVPLDEVWSARAARRLSDEVERAASGSPSRCAGPAGSTGASATAAVVRPTGVAGRTDVAGISGVAAAIEAQVRQAPGADTPRSDPLGRATMLRMVSAGSGVAEVARATGWSERQLRRHSRDLFGYGLVTLRRVLRLQAAVRLAGQGWSLAEVAARSGYADQAHLTREVVALTGRTPAVVLPRPAQPSGAKRSTGLPSGSSTVA